jgi:hypothetical protein
VKTMGFSKLPQNGSTSIFLLFSLTYSQILLILVIDDCQCGLHKKFGKNKQKICLSSLEPTISYYKVESKFLHEKNILLQLACGNHPHSSVQATILMPVRELEVKRALHHISYVFFG